MHGLHHVRPSTLRAGLNPARAWTQTRLIRVEDRAPADHSVEDLETLLREGDLLVLNDAATLPASLSATVRGQRVEVRLAAARGIGSFPQRWTVVLFGSGDWRTATENRPAPLLVREGDALVFGSFSAVVRQRYAVSPRLVDVDFDRSGSALAQAIYAEGAPIQYSYHHDRLRLSDVQTPYAARPWAMEMPSTGRPLHWPLLDRLVERGVQLAWLTHAAGISATGDPNLDAALPLPERYSVPEETMRQVRATRERGGRVVAVGTTVVRALESAMLSGKLRDVTDVRLGCPNNHCRVLAVDGILTGIHSPGESHYELLGAFADRATLDRAHRHAVERGYLAHEFGDLMLLWRE